MPNVSVVIQPPSSMALSLVMYNGHSAAYCIKFQFDIYIFLVHSVGRFCEVTDNQSVGKTYSDESKTG